MAFGIAHMVVRTMSCRDAAADRELIDAIAGASSVHYFTLYHLDT
jgi:hypothetical protein